MADRSIVLDDENTPTSDSGDAAPAAAAPRRRRAASRPAGPPAAATSAENVVAVPAVPAQAAAKSAKKTATKSTAKKTTAKKKAAEPAEQAPEVVETPPAAKRTRAKATAAVAADATDLTPTVPVLFQAPEAAPAPKRKRAAAAPAVAVEVEEASAESATESTSDASTTGEASEGEAARRRRRRGGRGRRKSSGGGDAAASETADDESTDEAQSSEEPAEDDESASTRRRRRRRRRGAGGDDDASTDDPPNTVVRVRAPREEVTAVRGSTRLEAKKQRRRDGREAGRRRAPILSEAEFLARREDVERVMVVREKDGRTQIAVLEDGILVEHYVDRGSSGSMVGNVYLGRVQNVLPSMEAAFVDIGRGRNAVLYAGEVNWDAAALDGQPKRIEFAMASGDPVLVQVTKDPMGHKGARLTSQISLPGRYLVYVPGGGMTGISRKLPDTERSRLKRVLKEIVPGEAGVIVRTAAEGATEAELQSDVSRLAAQWDDIAEKSTTVTPPTLLYGEPDLAIRVVRDIFNEDFTKLVVAGSDSWDTLQQYVTYVAPDLGERLEKWVGVDDVFGHYRVEEQLTKALDRKVWLPSGGSLVIDRTEAMTVVDVNTGKFTGQGGSNLEETVTRNNLEAAEEIVRQLRLRDIGGIIVVDFIDMVLESNRDSVLRRLVECLGRDRTKHQVAEITSLGLVQMTRKRIGQGLLETFSESCEHCNGRGVRVQMDPVTPPAEGGGSSRPTKASPSPRKSKAKGKSGADPADVMAAVSTAPEPQTSAPEPPVEESV